MMLVMQILAVLGVGAVIYAVFGIFTADNARPSLKQKTQGQPLPAQDLGKEQKIQRLQSQITKLEGQLEQSQVASLEEKSGLKTIEEKAAEFSTELKRREEWVARAEAELAKTKAEISDLNNKFTAKENELQEEFAKSVNLTRQTRETKAALEAKEAACRLQEDQLQAQKHQSESQLKSIDEHLAVIAEFKRKEKISEWVPKQEFNQLNTEYTKLEKELEASQERLKSFAAEIAHLHQLIDKKSPAAEEVKLPESISEKINSPEPVFEEIKPPEVISEEAEPEKPALEEIKPKEAAPEEAKQEIMELKENKALEKNNNVEESIENKIETTDKQE